MPALEPDYESELLLPPRVEDWIGPRHPARFVREFVKALDLESYGFKVKVAVTGRPGFSSDCLLCAWLYGYLIKQRSTRGLERACSSDMGAIWLTGNHQPDHNTLWTFFKSHRKAFKQILKQSARLACQMDMVDLSFVAIDGTKHLASARGKDGIWATDLNWALSALDEEAERYIQEVEASGNVASPQLPAELSDRASLRDAIKESLAELERLNAAGVSPVDPDARPMKTSEGVKLAYNTQVAVDSQSGIVLACEVVQDASDATYLNPMLDEVEETVGLRPDLTCADTGYFSAHQLALAAGQGRNVMVSMRGRAPKAGQPFHSWLFRMNGERNEMECPIGGRLGFRGRGKTHSGEDVVDRYHCKDHLFCPFAQICSKDPRGRVVEVGQNRAQVLRQWEKQKSQDARQAMTKRSATVERVFGHIKRNLGMNRLEHRGMDSVQAVWWLAASATNLVSLYRVWKGQ